MKPLASKQGTFLSKQGLLRVCPAPIWGLVQHCLSGHKMLLTSQQRAANYGRFGNCGFHRETSPEHHEGRRVRRLAP